MEVTKVLCKKAASFPSPAQKSHIFPLQVLAVGPKIHSLFGDSYLVRLNLFPVVLSLHFAHSLQGDYCSMCFLHQTPLQLGREHRSLVPIFAENSAGKSSLFSVNGPWQALFTNKNI